MPNPYYSPKDMGLEIIGSIDDAGSYEFNTLVAWKDVNTGEVFFGSDSGCSCPTPFDGFDRAAMTKITDRRALEEFKSQAKGWSVPFSERGSLINDVERAWRNWTRRKAQ